MSFECVPASLAGKQILTKAKRFLLTFTLWRHTERLSPVTRGCVLLLSRRICVHALIRNCSSPDRQCASAICIMRKRVRTHALLFRSAQDDFTPEPTPANKLTPPPPPPRLIFSTSAHVALSCLLRCFYFVYSVSVLFLFPSVHLFMYICSSCIFSLSSMFMSS